MVYLDDIVIYTTTWEEHLAMLDEVFLRLRQAGLKASPATIRLNVKLHRKRCCTWDIL